MKVTVTMSFSKYYSSMNFRVTVPGVPPMFSPQLKVALANATVPKDKIDSILDVIAASTQHWGQPFEFNI